MTAYEATVPDETARKLWRISSANARGPKPSHTIDDVVAIAIALADDEGLEAVSMKEIAQRLELTKMAVYRYVSSKSELVALMVEMAIGEPPNFSRVRGGWRAALTSWARHQRATWIAHPWLPDASNWQSYGTTSDRLLGPNELRTVEAAVAILSGSGLSGREILESVFLIGSYNRHALGSTTGRLLPWHADAGLTAGAAESLRQEFGDEFPHLTKNSRNASVAPHWDFGLRCILDGISAAIERKLRPRQR